jgi:putative membrane protein insertion efficiency factor
MREGCELVTAEETAKRRADAPAAADLLLQGVRKALRLASWPLVQVLILMVRGYQLLITPVMRPCCRFEPSCSRYAIVSLEKDGLVKGVLKTAWRLCRCQPYGKGGYDPP